MGNYVFDVTADHSCYTGFSLVGDNTRTCTGDGSSINGAFDGVAPTCERKLLINPYTEKPFTIVLEITCPALISPAGGSVSYGRAYPYGNGNYGFDVVATYYCDTGFSLVGNNSTTCTGNGSSITGAFNALGPICEGRLYIYR